jgi:hypothetical protein
MANNNIRLDIDVRGKGLLEAIKSTDSLEKNMKRLSDTYGRGGASYQQYYRAVQKLAEANGKSTKELLNHGKALRADTQAAKAYKDMIRQADAENRKFDQSVKQQAQSLHRLKMATDSSYASTNKLQAAKRVLKKEVHEGRMTLEQYVASMRKVVQANNAAGASAGMMSKHMSRGGVAMQQVGYQVGDFIVQVQSGQNAMVAFGQQATQMVGALYMLPPATLAGSVGIMGLSVSVGLLIASLGIIIPLATALGAAWMRTRKNTKESKDSIDLLTNSLKASTAAAKEAMSPISDLTEKYGEFAQAVRESARLAAQAQVTKAMDSLGAATEQTREGLNGFRSDFLRYGQELRLHKELAETLGERTRLNAAAFKDLDKGVTDAKNAVDASAEAMGLNTLQANNLYEALGLLESAEGPASIAQAAEDALDAIERMFPPTEKLPTEISDMVDQLRLVLKSAAEAAKTMEDMSKIDMTSNISSAAVAAGELADNLRIARGYRLDELAGGNVDFFDPRNESGTRGVITRERDVPEQNRAGYEPPKSSSSSGVGGGKSDAEVMQEKIAKLQEQLAVERELIGASEARVKIVRALGLEFVQNNPQVVEGLQEQINKNLELIQVEKDRQSVLDTIKSSMSDGFMSMVEGTKSVKDAFRDMAKDIIKQLYDVYVIQKMVGAVGEGGSAGTGIMGFLGGILGQKASGGTVMSNQPYLVGEKGPELIVPRNRGHVMNADLTSNAMGGGGSVVVNQTFNFSANGDDSVKRIIAQAAPSIANMAKQSVMDARRRGGAMKNTFG